MLDELNEHLQRGRFPALYPGEYSHITAITYNLLRWALRDEADTLTLNQHHFVWSREQRELGTLRIDSPKPIITYQSQLRSILTRDTVVQKYTRVVKNTDDEIVVEFAIMPE
jgi:hypothetical protein